MSFDRFSGISDGGTALDCDVNFAAKLYDKPRYRLTSQDSSPTLNSTNTTC